MQTINYWPFRWAVVVIVLLALARFYGG